MDKAKRESLRFKIIYMHTEAIKIMEKGKIDDAGERGGNSDYFGFLSEIGGPYHQLRICMREEILEI